MSAAALIALLAAAFAFTHRKVVAGEANPQGLAEIRALADRIIAETGFNVSRDMLVAVAWIESNFNPLAVRPEPHLNDASAGLMQTLLTTAQWLARDFPKYRGRGSPPDLETLMDADTSMYFGAAYLDWLSTWRGVRRDEEFIIRGYNGGPNNNSPQTLRYFEKYQEARRRFG